MCLVHRMRHDMQKRQRPKPQPALQQHEAHLRHGGPGKRGLDGALRQHDRRGKERREPSDHHQRRHRPAAFLHQTCQPDHQEAARVDDPGVKKRGYRSRGLHHFGQPAVQREAGGFQRGDKDQQRHGDLRGQRKTFGSGCGDCGKVGGAKGGPKQDSGGDQQGITRAPDQRELGSGALGFGPVGIEQQKLPHPKTDCDKGQHQNRKTARLHQRQDRRQRGQHQAVERPLTCFTVQIPARIAHNDPADECNQQRHRRADRIQPQGHGKSRAP